MRRFHSIPLARISCLLLAWTFPLVVTAQLRMSDIPPEFREELRSRGIDLEGVLFQAQQLGLNLENPQSAALRARQLGIPESRIREMLRVADELKRIRTDTPAGGAAAILQDAGPTGSGQAPRVTVSAPIVRRALTFQDSMKLAGGVVGEVASPYFGYEMFRRMPGIFEPSPVGPVDAAYLVGPGDELRLTVWGAAEFQYDLLVDQEGRVFLSSAGQFMVAGKRLDRLRIDMKRWLSRTYSGLTTDPPTVFMDVTLTRLRPIKVFVLGEVAQPGGYTLNSYSTVFNALYSVGGPLIRGSLRDIRVIREGKVISEVDFYDYLLKGYASRPTYLQDNDHIFIPLRGKTVSIQGEVKRPAIYELKPKEQFSQLLDYVGGLTADAYTKRVQIDRIVPFRHRKDPSIAREVLDVDLEPVLAGKRNIRLFDGDGIQIYSILNVLENAVSIHGAVKQPGRYELNRSVQTVRDLIRMADGLIGDAYQGKADLVRTRDDSTQVHISIDLARALEDHPTENLPLLPRDALYIYSTQDLVDTMSVQIFGEVRAPGVYAWRDSMTVYDLLFLGGGLLDEQFLKEVFLERADLFRKPPGGTDEIIVPFHLWEALNGRGMAAELLQPQDRIRIYPVYVEEIRDKFVTILGAVKEPGRYALQANMTVEDLILQAGGFTEEAYLLEATVSRLLDGRTSADERATEIIVPLTSTSVEGVSFTLADSAQALLGARQVTLQRRDRVYIRTDPDYERQETVTVTGEVKFPGTYTLLLVNETLSQVVARAGGVLASGYAQGGRLMRGRERVIIDLEEAISGKRRSDLNLLGGDEIIVPPKPNTVAVRGNVAIEGLIKYVAGKRLSYYLDRAGGVGENNENIFLTQASGATYKMGRTLLILRENPVVEDGAIITVTLQPEELDSATLDVGKTITEVFALISSALTIIVLATRL